MKRKLLLASLLIVLMSPMALLAENIPAKVYENGSDNNPIALSGGKVEVLGGYGNKARFSSGVIGSDGDCVLRNVPLGREVVVKLTKAGYVTQYDVRSFSEADVESGVVFWIGSEANVLGLYKNLGEVFDGKKGQVYIEVNNEMTGEGIEGVQFSVPSGKIFDLGQGEYLIANAEGASLKVEIQKPGYAFDIESVSVPLFAGAMTQYYVNVQAGGAVFESGQAAIATSAAITGYILRLSDSVPISGVTVAFMAPGGVAPVPSRPPVQTDRFGFYKQTGFQLLKLVRVIPAKPPWKFRPAMKWVLIRGTGAGVQVDFKGY
jgi:hypothetical protein